MPIFPSLTLEHAHNEHAIAKKKKRELEQTIRDAVHEAVREELLALLDCCPEAQDALRRHLEAGKE